MEKKMILYCCNCVYRKVYLNDLICTKLSTCFSKEIVYAESKCKCKKGLYKSVNNNAVEMEVG